jgi:hypothetical protein
MALAKAPLERRHDWEARLSALVAANRARPHAYGQWDCLLWPAAAVKAVTGRDFGRGHRGKYRSQASAYRHLQALGFKSPAALLDSLFEEKPVAFAGRGDLVLVKSESGEQPGVVVGASALVAGQQGEREGLIAMPRTAWLKAWAVGEQHAPHSDPGTAHE